MAWSPFEIREPSHGDTPILVEVPHAGVQLDPESMSWMSTAVHNIAREADLHVDELFAEAPRLGASLLVARVHRLVVDLNRAVDEYDDQAVVGGPRANHPRGVIWHRTSDGEPVLRQRLSRQEFERRIRHYYQPYHHTLRELLERKRRRFGFVVMLCAHSMPTPVTRGGAEAGAATGADLIPGTRNRTSCGERWIDLVDAVALEHGLSVQHDTPYRGGFTTAHYGSPGDGVHVLQLEIARRLYMDEARMRVDPEGIRVMAAFAGALVTSLVREGEQVYRQDAHHSSAHVDNELQ